MSKIVLIDQPGGTRDYLMKELEQSGHEVITTDRIEDIALEIKTNKPDLVVIDPLFAQSGDQPGIIQIKTWHPGTRVFAWLARSEKCDSQMISKADAFFIKNLLSADLIKNIMMVENYIPD